MSKYAIGLDNGGTVIKAAIYDFNGHEIAIASRKTKVLTPRPGYTERNMDTVWETNCQCIQEVLAKSGIPAGDISGIAVCGHGKGLYAWGEDGRPVGNGIVSTDNRAWEYPQRWKESGIWEKLYPRICQNFMASQPTALLAWMKDNDRAAYDSIQWIFSVKDYIRFRLTGEAYSELTDISGSGLINIRDVSVDPDMLEILGIGEVADKIPPFKRSSDMCGTVTREAAHMTGLAEGIPVIGGMFDINACALASDVTVPGQMCAITGTWSINECIAEKPVLNTEIAMNSLYALTPYYLLEESSPTGAGNLEWFIENNLKVPEGEKTYPYVDALVENLPPEDCAVYYLPFLYGSNAHPLAKATFVGLTSYHTTAHQLRAIFEGVAFSHKVHIDRLTSAAPINGALRLAGGVTNSRTWVQMFSDILGMDVETIQGVKELGALGCAMAVSVGIGRYASYAEAAHNMVRIRPAVHPDMKKHTIYKEKFALYKKIVLAMNSVWDDFAI